MAQGLLSVAFLFAVTWQKQLKERRVYVGSMFGEIESIKRGKAWQPATGA